MSFSRAFLFALLASSSLLSHAAVIVTPSAPLVTQDIHLQVINQYGSQASLSSAIVSRAGNEFLIRILVDLTYSLPAAPILSSDFNIGALPAATTTS
jgi:hypothetical protein